MPPPKMSWQFSANVPNMASIQVMSSPVEIEAVDQIAVTIEASSDPTVIGLQPSGINPIKLLVLKASRYEDKLNFSFADAEDNSAKASEEITLIAPQIFTESAMSAIFNDPKFLRVTNPVGEQPLDLFIYLVRDATP